MAFKLKHSNVKLSGDKASPFKVNLVQGARDAAGTFNDVGGALESGIAKTTAQSELIANQKTCVEQGLEGEALAECQAAAKLLKDKNNSSDPSIVDPEKIT